MLVVAQSGQVEDRLRLTESSRSFAIIVKTHDSVREGHVDKIFVKSDAKREKQMIGEDLPRLNTVFGNGKVQHDDLSGRGLSHEQVAVWRNCEPSRLVEAPGQDGRCEAGRKPWLKILREGNDNRRVIRSK